MALQRIKAGDIVKVSTHPKDYGVVLDSYEDDCGLIHLEVQWKDRKEWWSPFELELVSESR